MLLLRLIMLARYLPALLSNLSVAMQADAELALLGMARPFLQDRREYKQHMLRPCCSRVLCCAVLCCAVLCCADAVTS